MPEPLDHCPVCGNSNAVPRLEWTRTPPEKAGFYFYRNLFGCVQVVRYSPRRMRRPDCGGEWAGPIPFPANPSKEPA